MYAINPNMQISKTLQDAVIEQKRREDKKKSDYQYKLHFFRTTEDHVEMVELKKLENK